MILVLPLPPPIPPLSTEHAVQRIESAVFHERAARAFSDLNVLLGLAHSSGFLVAKSPFKSELPSKSGFRIVEVCLLGGVRLCAYIVLFLPCVSWPLAAPTSLYPTPCFPYYYYQAPGLGFGSSFVGV